MKVFIPSLVAIIFVVALTWNSCSGVPPIETQEPVSEENIGIPPNTDWRRYSPEVYDIESPRFGIDFPEPSRWHAIDKTFEDLRFDNIRDIDFSTIPYHVVLGLQAPYNREEARFFTTYGDLDGDGSEEALFFIESQPEYSSLSSEGILFELRNGRLTIRTVFADGGTDAKFQLGKLLGGFITPREVTIFRWYWDNMYSGPSPDGSTEEMMTVTTYRVRSRQLEATRHKGFYIKNFPGFYWPGEQFILSPERALEYAEKAKGDEVTLRKPPEEEEED
jgi:hypothetical protein